MAGFDSYRLISVTYFGCAVNYTFSFLFLAPLISIEFITLSVLLFLLCQVGGYGSVLFKYNVHKVLKSSVYSSVNFSQVMGTTKIRNMTSTLGASVVSLPDIALNTKNHHYSDLNHHV